MGDRKGKGKDSGKDKGSGKDKNNPKGKGKRKDWMLKGGVRRSDADAWADDDWVDCYFRGDD